ncbi:hypothetical protein QJS66_00180 [Kocuria rhizophila]|nr:hypothetical protein QJS66_00180 [Kocuria rhizophila]
MDDAHPETRVPRRAAHRRAGARPRGGLTPDRGTAGLARCFLPYRLEGGITHRQADLEPLGFLDSYANFFNGALVSSPCSPRGAAGPQAVPRGTLPGAGFAAAVSFGAMTTTAVRPGSGRERVVVTASCRC